MTDTFKWAIDALYIGLQTYIVKRGFDCLADYLKAQANKPKEREEPEL